MEQFKYWVYGASVVESEIDTRTGEYNFEHASLCLDVGKVMKKKRQICWFSFC
jgi:xanthine dehydrogenase molybdopterin-binding subunit B